MIFFTKSQKFDSGYRGLVDALEFDPGAVSVRNEWLGLGLTYPPLKYDRQAPPAELGCRYRDLAAEMIQSQFCNFGR